MSVLSHNQMSIDVRRRGAEESLQAKLSDAQREAIPCSKGRDLLLLGDAAREDRLD